MELNKAKTDETEDSSTSGDGDEADEPPTTSKVDDLNPQNKSHNMNDLTSLDLNSADDVRQTMKRIMGAKSPENCFEGKNSETLIDKHPKLKSAEQSIEQHVRNEDNLLEDNASKPVPASCSRKRRGRPSKAGPSRKIRRVNVEDMYLGKLSNVVPFHKRRDCHNYDSDTETVYIFRNFKNVCKKKN